MSKKLTKQNPLLKIFLLAILIFTLYLVSKKFIEMQILAKILLPSAPPRTSASDDSDYYTDLAPEYKTPLAQRIDTMASNLSALNGGVIKPDWLIGTMFLESSLTYPKKNSIGALGYIQMLPDSGQTYKTINGKKYEMSVIEAMTEAQYLDLMEEYFKEAINTRGKLSSFLDVYLAVLLPSAIGKPDDYVFPKWVTDSNSGYAVNGVITPVQLRKVLNDRVTKSALPINLT